MKHALCFFALAALCVSGSAFAKPKPLTIPVMLLSQGKGQKAFEYTKSCKQLDDKFFAQDQVYLVSDSKLRVTAPSACKDLGKSKNKNCVCSCARGEDPVILSSDIRKPLVACMSLASVVSGRFPKPTPGPVIPPSRFSH
jgi:hypothetical protein